MRAHFQITGVHVGRRLLRIGRVGTCAPIGLLGHDSVAITSTIKSVSFVELHMNMTGRGCDPLIACS